MFFYNLSFIMGMFMPANESQPAKYIGTPIMTDRQAAADNLRSAVAKLNEALKELRRLGMSTAITVPRNSTQHYIDGRTDFFSTAELSVRELIFVEKF